MRFFHHLASLIFLLGVGAGLYFLLLSPVDSRQLRLHERLVSTQAEITRLQTRITELENTAGTFEFPKNLVRVAADASAAEIALQDVVVQLAQAKGLNLMSFGAASLNHDHKAPTVAVSLEGSGALHDLYSFLAELEATSPPVAISQLRIRSGKHYGQEISGQPISFHATLWSFWEAQDG